MNGRGDALAVWAERGSDGPYLVLSSVRRAAASIWTPPVRVPLSDPLLTLSSYYGLSVALDDAGNATLVAQRGDGTVEASTYSIEGGTAWTGPTVLGDAGSDDPVLTDTWCVHPEIALDASGRALAVWGGANVYAAANAGGGSGTWAKPVVAATGPDCFARALAVDSTGNAVLIFNADERAVTRLDAAVRDVTPPLLTRLSVPRVAVVGQRMRFSISAYDRWSPLLGPPSWRFGDGGKGRGSTAGHVFRRGGRYRVKVTAFDLAGNAATASTVIHVKDR
jgi:hypothetical protein